MDLFGNGIVEENNTILLSGKFTGSEILENNYSIPKRGLVVVECKDSYYSTEIIKELTGKWLGDENLSSQLFLQSPQGLSWKMEEIESLIIAPSSKIALKVNIIIVTHADFMEERAYDKLLKTIEEPFSNTIFVMLVKDKNNLKNTILGRANLTIELMTPRIEELLKYSDSKAEVNNYYYASNSNLLVTRAMLEDETLYEDQLSLNELITNTNNPASTTRELISKLELVAKKIIKTEIGQELEGKNISKEILLGLLEVYGKTTRSMIKEGKDISKIKERDKALSLFAMGSKFNTPLTLLLFRLLSV